MTINLEHIAGVDEAVRRNFERLQSLTIDTGGQTVALRFGVDVVTFDGSGDTSPATTVSHGLATTPVVVFTQSRGIDYHARPANEDADSFTVQMRHIDGDTPADETEAGFYWLAVG